jgi:hypothetical protein
MPLAKPFKRLVLVGISGPVFYLTGYMYQSNSRIFADKSGMRYNGMCLALKRLEMSDVWPWDNASWTAVRSKREPTHTINVESAQLIGRNNVITKIAEVRFYPI